MNRQIAAPNHGSFTVAIQEVFFYFFFFRCLLLLVTSWGIFRIERPRGFTLMPLELDNITFSNELLIIACSFNPYLLDEQKCSNRAKSKTNEQLYE